MKYFGHYQVCSDYSSGRLALIAVLNLKQTKCYQTNKLIFRLGELVTHLERGDDNSELAQYNCRKIRLGEQMEMMFLISESAL